jgi:hypothetical protein
MSQQAVVCLYFGNPEECQGCGGWVKAEGGPFPGDPRYCSEDCFADAQEFAAHQEARRTRLACCPDCGYDCGEHNPACTASGAKRQEGGAR